MLLGYVTPPSSDLLTPEHGEQPFLTSKVAAAISMVALLCLQSVPPGTCLAIGRTAPAAPGARPAARQLCHYLPSSAPLTDTRASSAGTGLCNTLIVSGSPCSNGMPGTQCMLMLSRACLARGAVHGEGRQADGAAVQSGPAEGLQHHLLHLPHLGLRCRHKGGVWEEPAARAVDRRTGADCLQPQPLLCMHAGEQLTTSHFLSPLQGLYALMGAGGGALRLWAMAIMQQQFTFEVGIVKDHKCASRPVPACIGLPLVACMHSSACMHLFPSTHTRRRARERNCFMQVLGPRSILLPCRLVQSGPYRYIRHPGYTGALLSFTGALAILGLQPLTLAWWLIFAGPMSLFMVSCASALHKQAVVAGAGGHNSMRMQDYVAARQREAPTSSMYLRLQVSRIRDEEATLHQHFGAQWEQHCRRTWRLLPPIF